MPQLVASCGPELNTGIVGGSVLLFGPCQNALELAFFPCHKELGGEGGDGEEVWAVCLHACGVA